MSSTGLLGQLHQLNRSSSAFHDQLSSILYGEEFNSQAPNLQSDSLVWLVDYLDKALDTLDPASPAFRKCLRELRNICGTRMILPTSYTLSSSLLNIGRQPVASGGSGDIYRGTLNGLNVCVKRVRVYSKEGPKKATKTLYQEAVVWKHLTHPNVVPLLGITPVPLQLISEWMPGGDLTEYIKSTPDANRLGLLSDVAEGLYYLHSCNIVHGDLKGPNILVDPAGGARITDFGLATVTQNLDSIRSASDDKGHTARWTAPEILNEQGTYSKEADVFSFAMVMIEVFTGAVPFNTNLPAAAVLAIMSGTRPSRPTHSDFTDELWTLMQHCWDQDPHLRPEVSEVLKALSGSDPVPIKPPIYRLPSTATLKIGLGQKELFAGYPMGSHTPSLHKKASSSSRYTPQTTPEKPNNSIGPPPPESRSVGTGLNQGGDRRPRDRSNDPPLGQRGGLVARMPSHRSTTGSESSPMPIDPQPFDWGELQKGQVHNQVYGPAGGTWKSHTDRQSSRGGRTASKRDVSGKGSQFDLNRDLDDNDEGKYWSEAQRDNRGASRSALSLGTTKRTGGHHGSRDLLDAVQNNLPYGRSKISLHGEGGASPGPSNIGDEALSRRASKKRTPGMNPGDADMKASRDELRTGAKSRGESRTDLSKPIFESPRLPYLQAPRNPQGPPQQSTGHAGSPSPGATDENGSKREQGNNNSSDRMLGGSEKKHGIWCRIKKKLFCR